MAPTLAPLRRRRKEAYESATERHRDRVPGRRAWPGGAAEPRLLRHRWIVGRPAGGPRRRLPRHQLGHARPRPDREPVRCRAVLGRAHRGRHARRTERMKEEDAMLEGKTRISPV